jgi:hypothetical protein
MGTLLHRDLKIIKYNSSLRQITGIQKKLDTKHKQKTSQQVTQDNKILQTKKEKELGKTVEKTLGCLRPERVNKCPNPVTAT